MNLCDNSQPPSPPCLSLSRRLINLCCIISLVMLPLQPAVAYQTTMEYYHYNHQGSLLEVYDGASNKRLLSQAWSPWGERQVLHAAASGDNKNIGHLLSHGLPVHRGYTGHKELLATGLAFAGDTRLYDARLKRFLNSDDRTTGGVRGQNRYSYAYNNPMTYIDPDGRMPEVSTFEILGGPESASRVTGTRGRNSWTAGLASRLFLSLTGAAMRNKMRSRMAVLGTGAALGIGSSAFGIVTGSAEVTTAAAPILATFIYGLAALSYSSYFSFGTQDLGGLPNSILSYAFTTNAATSVFSSVTGAMLPIMLHSYKNPRVDFDLVALIGASSLWSLGATLAQQLIIGGVLRENTLETQAPFLGHQDSPHAITAGNKAGAFIGSYLAAMSTTNLLSTEVLALSLGAMPGSTLTGVTSLVSTAMLLPHAFNIAGLVAPIAAQKAFMKMLGVCLICYVPNAYFFSTINNEHQVEPYLRFNISNSSILLPF